MFRNLYNNTADWNRYINLHGDLAQKVRDIFRTDFYDIAGWLFILLPLIICLIYYYYLNARFGKYYKVSHWFWTLVISELLLFGITVAVGLALTKRFPIPTAHFVWRVGFLNLGYGLITFIIFSLLIKWWSSMGKRTPF